MGKLRYDPFANSQFAEDVKQKSKPVVKPVEVKPEAEPQVKLEAKPEVAQAAKSSPELDAQKAKWNEEMTVSLVAKGIAREDIRAWDNVLTFNGWLKHGRCVMLGEHGVKNGKYTVFHISQTKPLTDPRPSQPKPRAEKKWQRTKHGRIPEAAVNLMVNSFLAALKKKVGNDPK